MPLDARARDGNAAGAAGAQPRKRPASHAAAAAAPAAPPAAQRRRTHDSASARLTQLADQSDREIAGHCGGWRGFAASQVKALPTPHMPCARAASAQRGAGQTLDELLQCQAWAALGESALAAPGSQDVASSVSLGDGLVA